MKNHLIFFLLKEKYGGVELDKTLVSRSMESEKNLLVQFWYSKKQERGAL